MINPSYIGLVAGLLCALSFLPQVMKIYREKSTHDLSLPTFAVFSLGVFLWLVYGIILGEPAIILANVLMLILALAIVVMKIKYK